MKVYKTNEIKNIAIVGNSGSGKTTLAEAMLFECGLIKRRGTIDGKNTVSDYFPVEKEYGYSVFSTVFSYEWKNKLMTLIDCPGSDDFSGNISSALGVTDLAVMLIDATSGVEVGTINQFRQIESLDKPLMFVMNRIDHEKADFENTITNLKEFYGNKVTPIQYPTGSGLAFDGIVDVLKQKLYKWKPGATAPDVLEIPDSEKEKAGEYYQVLLEAAAENDETLMEKYFDQGTLSEEEMLEGIQKGMISRDLFPVFCVSAEKNMAVHRLMNFLTLAAPSPDQVPSPQNSDGETVEPDPGALTSLFFFKTTVEPHIGEVSYFKVMSGKVKEGDDLTNTNRSSKERIAQMYLVAGQMRNKVEELQAGSIAAAVKLKDVRTGNTLNAKGSDNRFNFIQFPEPRYRRAVKARTEANSEKLSEALTRMREEDPSLVIEVSKELKQTIVSGQGEFHLKTMKWRLENNDKIEIDFLEPKIPYRETITKQSRADYRHKKQSGGAGQFGEVHLIVEPYTEGMPMPEIYRFNGQEFKIQSRDVQTIDLDWGGKLVFVNSIVGGAIDARFLPAILKGIMGRMEQGPLTGSYARDVRVIVYDGKMHPVDSNEISFMLAGRNAFSTAFKNAGPKILEPIYDVVVSVPSDYMGDVMSDLQGRRAMIMGMESEKGFEKLKARVPLKEMSSYSTSLSSLTGGRASFTMKFSEYELVPSDVQDKLLKEYEAEEKEE
ncbi:MAG TPA: elongation factor G [Porphyromonadaceae bacterium]|jgi:elongation factor G|uniref:elongation factor G n=1 Tax=Petrimonas TaxID=307628 RepID=UPI000EEA281F|nr:elongation factor G [Petrimonas sp.]NLU29721.1 elongation factor G [Bacteroidales bacterium]BBD45912.1 translation elongation factor G [Petrimonas sp. IBARAKI]HAC74280.1 elongation factor G [Porphyromonadaceae bacterium]MDD4015495.1 elongation factor G [Petrimonas sp.]